MSISYWRAGDDYRLQTDDPEIARRVAGWEYTKRAGAGVNIFLRFFTIPRKHDKKTRRRLGMEKTGDVFHKPTKEQ